MLQRITIIGVIALSACGPAVVTPPPACTASTCAGCCDAAGQCQEGAQLTACGRLGLACATCQSSQSCVAGLCQGAISTGGGSAGGDATGGGTAGGAAGGETAGGASGGAVTGGGTPTGGGSTAGGGGGGSTVGGGAAGGSVTRSTRFQSTPLRFSVPATTFNSLASAAAQGSTRSNWATLDLNGDRRVDLALTSDPQTGAIFATGSVTHWNVHLGTATGFSSAATQWIVPANPSVAQGYTLANSATGSSFWSTIDLSGDGRPDLVHTMNPLNMGPYVSMAGSPTDGWLVRRGLSNGFEATPITVTVPRVAALSGGLDRTINDTVTRRWLLTEVTGDALIDLVITADPATDSVWSLNLRTNWVVCPGTAAGFGTFTACQQLPVPDNGIGGGFKSATSFATSTRRVWLLADMNGDGRADLVQTMNPVGGTLGEPFLLNGAPYWKVWLNVYGTARDALYAATPTQWTVPSIAFSTPSSATAPQFWQLMDLDGDRIPELVQTADPTTGRPFAGPSWRVFSANTSATGFLARVAAIWTIPVGPGLDGFRSVSGASWAVLDVTGDGLPDLVQFQNPATGLAFTDVTGPFWRVYPGIP